MHRHFADFQVFADIALPGDGQMKGMGQEHGLTLPEDEQRRRAGVRRLAEIGDSGKIT